MYKPSQTDVYISMLYYSTPDLSSNNTVEHDQGYDKLTTYIYSPNYPHYYGGGQTYTWIIKGRDQAFSIIFYLLDLAVPDAQKQVCLNFNIIYFLRYFIMHCTSKT